MSRSVKEGRTGFPGVPTDREILPRCQGVPTVPVGGPRSFDGFSLHPQPLPDRVTGPTHAQSLGEETGCPPFWALWVCLHPPELGGRRTLLSCWNDPWKVVTRSLHRQRVGTGVRSVRDLRVPGEESVLGRVHGVDHGGARRSPAPSRHDLKGRRPRTGPPKDVSGDQGLLPRGAASDR